MTARLLAFGLMAALLGAQEGAESRPGARIELPLADQAKPFADEAPILVEVFRNADVATEATEKSLASWRVGLGTRTYGLIGGNLEARFAGDLQRLVPPKSAAHASLLIRADGKAPYLLIVRILERATDAKLSRIFLETRSEPGSPARALFCRLPREDDPPDPEGLPDIRLAVLLSRGSAVRTFDINPRRIATGPGGDRQLEGMLRTKYDDYRSLWKVDIPVVVEGGVLVPWEQVVDLVNLAQRVGVKRIEFAEGPLEPPPSPKERRFRERALPEVEPSPGELTSRPAPEITAPASSQAVRFDEKNAVEVWIFRDPTAAAPATRPHPEWRWRIGNRVYAFDAPGFKGMAVNLARRAGTRPPALSARTVLIRADGRAPYGIVQKTLEAASMARVYKIHFGAVHDPSVPREAVACWLPRSKAGEAEDAAEEPELRLLMSWNSEANRLERLLGRTVHPVTSEGNARLESVLRAEHQRSTEQGKSVPLIIDAGPRVPFQYIIDALDLAEKVGIERVEFGMGSAMK